MGRRNSRSHCVANRTESITSNTKCFKFSTTHYIFLIFCLVKEIIRRTSFTSFSDIWVYSFITSFNNIFKVRTRKIFFKRGRMRKNINHRLKYFIISGISTVTRSSRHFTIFSKCRKTCFFSKFFYFSKTSSFSLFNAFYKFFPIISISIVYSIIYLSTKIYILCNSLLSFII